MNIFGVAEAMYYCRRFQHAGGLSSGSLVTYVQGSLSGVTSLKEGTLTFSNYRDCALREVERTWFLAVSNYRRALDLMMPGAVSWAHVTLYYSAYFAATALLGMFGGSITRYAVIDVVASAPGQQELAVTRKVQSTYRGPHQRFWDLFYGAMTSLIPWIDPKYRIAITSVSNSITWQIDNRNDINYDSFQAFQLASNFQRSFRPTKFPRSLPGNINTQFVITETLLLLTSKFIRQFRLNTDVCNLLLPAGSRKAQIESLVFRAKPLKLLRKGKRKSFTL